MKCPAAVISSVLGRPLARSKVTVYQAGIEGSTQEAVTRVGVWWTTRTSVNFVPQGAVGWGSRTLCDGVHAWPGATRSQRRLRMTIPPAPPSIAYSRLYG